MSGVAPCRQAAVMYRVPWKKALTLSQKEGSTLNCAPSADAATGNGPPVKLLAALPLRRRSRGERRLMLCPCRLLRYPCLWSYARCGTKIRSQHEHQEHTDDQGSKGNHPHGQSFEA